MKTLITLFHGTSEECANRLLTNGWMPNQEASGGNCENPNFLYLTNDPENARWFANEKGERRRTSRISEGCI